MLGFLEGVEIRVKGLDEILAELYAEGRPANEETAKEIITRLDAKRNCIRSSDRARKQYAFVLLTAKAIAVHKRLKALDLAMADRFFHECVLP
jgi:hypothetical protein